MLIEQNSHPRDTTSYITISPSPSAIPTNPIRSQTQPQKIRPQNKPHLAQCNL